MKVDLRHFVDDALYHVQLGSQRHPAIVTYHPFLGDSAMLVSYRRDAFYVEAQSSPRHMDPVTQENGVFQTNRRSSRVIDDRLIDAYSTRFIEAGCKL